MIFYKKLLLINRLLFFFITILFGLVLISYFFQLIHSLYFYIIILTLMFIIYVYFYILYNRLKKEKKRLIDIKNNLTKKQKELENIKNKIQNELNLARKTQRKLIPQRSFEYHDYKFLIKYIPAIQIGGDYCEVFEIDNDMMGFVIADVSGHGVSSALISSMIKIICSLTKDLLVELHIFLKYVNYYLYDMFAGHYLTMIGGIIDLKKHVMKISNAGHCYPIIIDKQNKEIKKLEIQGMCIGISPDLDFNILKIELPVNSRFFLFTDGLFDFLINNDEIYGEERLIENIYKNIDFDQENFTKNILLEVFKYRHDHNLDDIALLLIDRN